jgi:hypothetical protein
MYSKPALYNCHRFAMNFLLKLPHTRLMFLQPVAVSVAVLPAHIVAGVTAGAAGVAVTVTVTVVRDWYNQIPWFVHNNW